MAAAYQNVELEEVETGETFSISEINETVLIQTFAVWCTICSNQHSQTDQLRDQRDDFQPVSLNIDPNEGGDQIAGYKQNNNFDWRFAVSPSDMTDSLVDEHGQTMLNAPSASIVVVCENGDSYGPFTGVQTPGEISDELEAC